MYQNWQEMLIAKVSAPEAGADAVIETRRGASIYTQMSLPICAVIINSRSNEGRIGRANRRRLGRRARGLLVPERKFHYSSAQERER